MALGIDVSALRAAQFLVLDLFTGMDGLGYALDLVGLGDWLRQHSLSIMFETDPRCRRLLAKRRVRQGVALSQAPDASDGSPTGSVFALTDDDCSLLKELLDVAVNLKHLLIAGGSPCVGFSGAKPGGRGIDDPESRKLWALPVLVAVAKAHRPQLGVYFILENVEMGPRAPPLEEVFGVPVVHMCTSLVLPANRPRIYITNLIAPKLEAVEVDPVAPLAIGWRPLWELLPDRGQPDRSQPPRFGTFLRPFGPGRPREFPAKYHRLPLSCYNERGLVYRPDAPAAILDQIRGLIKSGMRIPTHDLKKLGGKSIEQRGKVAAFIHQDGNSRWLRPVSATERDLCLGFPALASSLDDSSEHSALDWDRMEATGNAFAVPVVASLLRPLASHLLSGSALPLHPGAPSCLNAASALELLGASSTQPNHTR